MSMRSISPIISKPRSATHWKLQGALVQVIVSVRSGRCLVGREAWQRQLVKHATRRDKNPCRRILVVDDELRVQGAVHRGGFDGLLGHFHLAVEECHEVVVGSFGVHATQTQGPLPIRHLDDGHVSVGQPVHLCDLRDGQPTIFVKVAVNRGSSELHADLHRFEVAAHHGEVLEHGSGHATIFRRHRLAPNGQHLGILLTLNR